MPEAIAKAGFQLGQLVPLAPNCGRVPGYGFSQMPPGVLIPTHKGTSQSVWKMAESPVSILVQKIIWKSVPNFFPEDTFATKLLKTAPNIHDFKFLH